MTVNFKTRVGHRLVAINREGNSMMSSVRTKRIAAATIGLAAAVCMTLGASAITPAFAATSSAGTVMSAPTKPSAALSTDNPQRTSQGRDSAHGGYYCNYVYSGYYNGYYDGQLYYGNHYYPCNYVAPQYIPYYPGGGY